MPSGYNPAPGDGYPPAPAPGYPQAPGYQAPSPGYQAPSPSGYQAPPPGYPQAPGQGGYPQAPTQAAPSGIPPAQAPYAPGYQQPVPGQGGGYGIGGVPPTSPGSWQPGGVTYGPVGGPGGPRRSKRGLFVALGLIVLLIVVIVIAASLGGSKTPSATGSTPPTVSTPPVQPTTPPVSTTPPPVGGVEPLSTIMNPAGLTPVGTSCVRAITNGLNASTLIGRTFCSKTTRSNTVVWGYQFAGRGAYLAGLAHINSTTGFSSSGASGNCPPTGGAADGSTGWHANSNPRYKSRNGQILECYFDHTTKGTYPIIVWTMPTQHVVFISQHRVSGSTLTTLVKWWETLDYG
jgi:hypothetical protein